MKENPISPIIAPNLVVFTFFWDNIYYMINILQNCDYGSLFLGRQLKISLFPVERPGEIILRLYPAAFFVCVCDK